MAVVPAQSVRLEYVEIGGGAEGLCIWYALLLLSLFKADGAACDEYPDAEY